jgi:hypothetical protein
MPELPDIVTYIKALESRIVGQRLIRVRVASTFLVRTAHLLSAIGYLSCASPAICYALRPLMPQRHSEIEKNKADQQQPGAKPLKELPAIARLLPMRWRIFRVPSPGRQVNWDIENQGGDKRGQEDERRRPTNKARHTQGRSQL